MPVRTQRGITIWGMMVVAILIAFFALIGIKLFPVYMTDMKIKGALGGLSRDISARDASKTELITKLGKRLEIDNVDNVLDYRKDITFEKKGRARVMRVQYESVTPLFYNLSVLAQFDHTVEVGTFVGE